MADDFFAGLNKEKDEDDFFSGLGTGKSGSATEDDFWANLGKEEEVEYSTGRQSVVSFFEGALGVGTEADALFRSIGSDMSYEEALAETQKRQRAFREDNDALATATEWGGIAAGFLVPGGVLAKSGQAVSKARQVGLAAGEGAAFGAFYGGMTEDLETGERDPLTGALVGGAIGGIAGKFLLKNQDELARIEEDLRSVEGRNTHIWGDDGIAQGDIVKVKEPNKTIDSETSAQEKRRGTATLKEKAASALMSERGLLKETADKIDWATLGTREWLEKNAGLRGARLVSYAEQEMRKMDQNVTEIMMPFEKAAREQLDASPALTEAFVNMGRKGPVGAKGPQIPKSWDEARKLFDEDSPIGQMSKMFDEVNANDLPNWKDSDQPIPDYFPSGAKGPMKKGVQARVDDYHDPVSMFKEYTQDVMNARTLASTFFKQDADDVLAKLKPAYKGQSRTDALISAIEAEAKKQGGGTETAGIAAHNLAAGLRATLVASKQGGDKVGSMTRKLSSTGLLANWSNAMLNLIEGVTLPIYANGVVATAQSAIPAIGGTINSIARQAGKKDPVFKMEWINNQQMGLDRQFMGEVHADAKKGIGKLVDGLSEIGYKVSGVHTVNTMGQEIAGNSGVKRAISEAKKAVESGDYSKYAKLKANRGMTEKELRDSARGLADYGYKSKWAREAYAQTLGLLQPGYASSMPMAFNNHPNGRMFYGMLSYMNRQYNRIRTDIYQNAYDVQRFGINTIEGKQAYKAALRNATMYAATMGLANGIWDDFRKDVMDAGERDEWGEYFSGDARIRGYEIKDINDAVSFMATTAGNQLASNTTSGLLNVRAEEYGGQMFNPLGAPAPTMAIKGVNALADAATGDLDKLGRFTQTYVPVAAQADRVTRAVTGDRLMEAIDNVGKPQAGGMLSNEELYKLIGE